MAYKAALGLGTSAALFVMLGGGCQSSPKNMAGPGITPTPGGAAFAQDSKPGSVNPPFSPGGLSQTGTSQTGTSQTGISQTGINQAANMAPSTSAASAVPLIQPPPPAFLTSTSNNSTVTSTTGNPPFGNAPISNAPISNAPISNAPIGHAPFGNASPFPPSSLDSAIPTAPPTTTFNSNDPKSNER
ncbi:MAG: hypothetical protein HY040_04120 [Planctomycetes bacterium]|nr:hypothetical protein [Planctomycetota bacterium]